MENSNSHVSEAQVITLFKNSTRLMKERRQINL